MNSIQANFSDSYILTEKNTNRPLDANKMIDDYIAVNDLKNSFKLRNTTVEPMIVQKLDDIDEMVHEICTLREGTHESQSRVLKSEFALLISGIYKEYFYIVNFFQSSNQNNRINVRLDAIRIATKYVKLATEPPLL